MGLTMTHWIDHLGDLSLVASDDAPTDQRPYLCFISAQGDVLVEPVAVDHLPHPGACLPVGGIVYALSSSPPVTLRKKVDDGLRDLVVDVATYTATCHGPTEQPKPKRTRFVRAEQILTVAEKFLPRDQVSMLRKYIINKHLQREIAAQMGRPQSTVSYRIDAALRWMRSVGIRPYANRSDGRLNLRCSDETFRHLQERPAEIVKTPGRNAKRPAQPKATDPAPQEAGVSNG
jgi:hypothetical protein